MFELNNIMVGLIVGLVALVIKGFGFLLSLFKFWVKKKSAESTKLYVEDWLYQNIYSKDIKPLYAITQSSFRYCMQNKLLHRKDILEFKEKLNNCVNLKDYRHEKFKNDAHEIYRKLKSTCISKQNMQMLNEFLQPYITMYKASKPQGKVYNGYLTVIK